MQKTSDQDTAEFFLPVSNFDIETPHPFSAEVRVEFGAISDKGKVRTNNEDAFLVFRTGRYWQKLLTNVEQDLLPERHDEIAYAMAVADGMGGLAAGEIASSMVLSTVVNLMLSSVKWALKLDHPQFREEEIEQAIQRAVDYLSKADLAIADRAQREQAYKGMGTTLTASYSFGDDLFILHVGDSRAYHLHADKLSRLTRDHTVAQELADRGDISQDAVATHHFKHILTRAVGRNRGKLDVEIHHFKVTNNDLVLLCTDGLSDLVNDQQIAAVLSSDGSPQSKCEGLKDLALDRGGKDNITAVLAEYHMPVSTKKK